MSNTRSLIWTVSRSLALSTAAIALLSYSGHNFDRHSARGVALAETPASEPASRLDVFTGADGESYFALSLRPTIAAPPSTPHDICLLIDTSASQTGRFRDRAVESLQAVLASLSAEDRVQLSAVDLDIAPLTADFVAPNSDAMAEGIKQLSRRPSLGTTDLGLVLGKACELLEKSSGSRAIVYIGDGMSTANLLPTDKLDALMNKCVANRVAVTSLGLGPNIDTVLLAVLANHTGGNLALDNGQMSPQSLGQYLAQSAIGPVLWPTQITLPAGVREAYPRRAPPLRFDRDSVLIGAGEITTPQSAKIVVNTASATETLSWEISPSESLEDNAYLRELVVNARKTDGKTLATVGTAGLREARWTTNAAARDLVKLARQAIATGATDNAKRLVGEALRRDPANAEAQAIQGGLEKQAEENAAPSDDLKLIHKRASSPFRLAAYQPPLAEDVAPPAFAPIRQNGLDRPGSLLAEEERRQRSFTEYMQAEVRNTLNAARSQMRVDPAGASEQLKTMLEMVRQAADLPANVRSDLRGQLERALQEAARQLVIKTDRDLSAQAIAAQQREQAQLTRELLAEEEKVDQLIARFNSLLDEGRFRDAEAVADVALALKPATPALEAAVLDARTVGYTVANFALREARQKGVIDTLQSVEASHIPTSDEPPIIYPDPEVWQLLTERRKKKYESVDLASSNKAEAKILAALDGETSIAFVETALGDAILELETQHDIQIELDTTELENLGITSDGTTLTRDLKGITLRSALKILLRDLDLTYIIENEVLLITSIEVAETKLTTKVYPVADLVVPPQTPQIGGGLGGGQGGQMGGGGGLGGGGGGGFGGGGGGGGFGGGGGQGGGGGGFFNVPPQFLPADVQNRLRQGFQAFAVEDDLKLSSDPVPATAKDAASSPNQGRTQTATIELPEGSDPKTAWDEYFASHDADPAALRETVRRSLKAKNYSQTVALIHAALLHGQGQPWMYEGLGIALQASGAPMVDVERAIMSALDFGATNNDLMYVAQYLSSLGAEKRAFELFRQVGDREPTRPEPFVHGLRLAKRLNDLDAIQWATIGVLSQAWTEKQRSVWDEAYHTALATLKRLQNERRTVEAQSYENALKEALIRDCVIIVSWTGDADIDLMVEEPGGSICSYRTPRTTAGGIMLGDTVSRPEKASSDGFQEVYVCPRGFSGDYRLLVRRVWGKVTADKVTVDIYKNYMTDKEELIHEQLPLGEKDALVTFAVNEGRRSESVAEHEIAQAVAEQVAIGNQVLAQQAAAANNGAAAAALANSLSDTPNPNPGNGNGFNSPFFLRGAVGYQPVIITLPEGAMLQAQAVISADRRYVRYSGLPFFSGVSEVNTFNYVSGASGTSQGGTGGIGGGGGSGGAGGIGGGGSGGF